MNKKKLFVLVIILFSFYSLSINSREKSVDDHIIEKISFVLINEYDNYKDKSFTEKIALKLGRNTYMDSIELWKKNYNNIESLKITLHPKLEYMAQKGDEYLKPERAKYFRKLLIDLSRLGFKNLQIFYIATKEYLNIYSLSFYKIDKDLIDDAICQPKYYDEKIKLYKKEDFIKNEIRIILKEGKLKYKLAFYSFAFNFFDKIRKKVIKKDIERMLAKINKKEKK